MASRDATAARSAASAFVISLVTVAHDDMSSVEVDGSSASNSSAIRLAINASSAAAGLEASSFVSAESEFIGTAASLPCWSLAIGGLDADDGASDRLAIPKRST